MRRIVIAIMGTLSGLVMLFSYHTSTNSGSAVAATTTGGTTSDTSPATSTAPSTSATPSTSSSSSGTYTGDAVSTRWGTVQVQITVQGGKVTKSEAVRYPSDNPRDQEINAYALPILAQEAVAAQSARIDAVSGATVTSGGYVQSLQSAIDQAHL
jgi:uncharacterized protein with FMN-binding domain